MNRFASHNPERYEQMIREHGTIEEAFRANADMIRQRQKDQPACPQCHQEMFGPTCQNGHCARYGK